MKLLTFKSFTLLGMLMAALPLLADETGDVARFRSVQIQLRGNKQTLAKVQTETIKTLAQMRKLRQAKATPQSKAVCAACAEVATEHCSSPDSDEANTAVVAPEPKNTSCWRTYQNKECYSALPANARAKVNSCFEVQNDIALVALEGKLAKLRERREWVANEQASLMNEHSALKEELALQGELDSVGSTLCSNCPETQVVVAPNGTSSRSPASEE